MHLVCCCSLPVWRRSSLKKGTPRYLSWPRPGSAPGRIWPKNNNTCKGPWVIHPYQVSSKSIKRFWRRSWKCKLSNGRQTGDGRTTDYGQRVITIGHWSLWLLCPKNCHPNEILHCLNVLFNEMATICTIQWFSTFYISISNPWRHILK